MQKFIFLTLIMVTSFYINAQQSPAMFKEAVFEKVAVRKNLEYETAASTGVKQKYFRFDFYEPQDDNRTKRPLIIWLHGGGFKFGKKTSGGLPLWSKTFAQRGYACAAVNYRLSKKHPLKNFEDLVEGCADAIEDVKKAIAYFKQHAAEYRIDTNIIILGGNSAGGMISLQAAYSSSSAMNALIHKNDTAEATAILNEPVKVAAVVNFWGALFDINWLQNARVPIVSVHGKKDRVVHYDSNNGMHGSLSIHQGADSLQIPNTIKIYDNYSHELQKHFNPLFAGGAAKKRWLEAGQFVADFLYQQLFQKKEGTKN